MVPLKAFLCRNELFKALYARFLSLHYARDPTPLERQCGGVQDTWMEISWRGWATR